MPRPHVSVIVTVYNQKRYLAEAIRSVLDQDYHDVEIIVVDDGSTDHSAQAARAFEGVRVIRQNNRGYGAAVNTGVSAARGELIAFLDADDFWEPETLARRVDWFSDDQEFSITHGMLVEFVSPELEAPGVSRGRAVGEPVPGPVGGTMMIRLADMKRVGPLDTTVRLGSMMDWLMRASKFGLQTRFHEEVLLHRRIHNDNLGMRERTARGDYVKVLKLALDRRRKARSHAEL